MSSKVLLQKIRRFNQKLNRMQYIAPDDFFNDYRYLNTREFQKQKGGVCWDYVLYETEYFQKHFPTVQTEAYFFCGIDKDNDMPSHTVLLFFLDDKTYWFESSWKSKSGIYEFNSKKEALQKIQKLHKDFCINEQKETLVDYVIIKYEPSDEKLKGIGCGGFYEYMNKQEVVDFKSIESFINYCNDMMIAEEGLFTKMLKKHSDRKQARLKEREERRQAFIANKKQAIPHIHKLANEFVKVYNTLVGSQVMEIDKDDIEDYDNQYTIVITVNSDSFDRDALSKTISNMESKFGMMMDKYRITVFTEFGGPWVSVGVDDISFNTKDWSEWNRFLN